MTLDGFTKKTLLAVTLNAVFNLHFLDTFLDVKSPIFTIFFSNAIAKILTFLNILRNAIFSATYFKKYESRNQHTSHRF